MPVELVDEQDDPLEPGPLAALARLVLDAEGIPPTALVSITFVGSDRMAELNALHLGKDGPTDVLSLPIEDLTPGSRPETGRDGPPLVVGDVVIAPSVVRAQAETAGVAFDDEMSLMVVHGLLHLLGYDHEHDDDAELMEGRERDLLAAVGVSRP